MIKSHPRVLRHGGAFQMQTSSCSSAFYHPLPESCNVVKTFIEWKSDVRFLCRRARSCPLINCTDASVEKFAVTSDPGTTTKEKVVLDLCTY